MNIKYWRAKTSRINVLNCRFSRIKLATICVVIIKMTKGITGKEPDPRVVYADIIDLPHHQSTKHPHMSLYDRSAQFASYKALSGYEDMVAEEARQTEAMVGREDYELSLMDQKLKLIAECIRKGQKPILTFTVFVPDATKTGGSYEEITDTVRKVDTAERRVILASTTGISGIYVTIDFDSIVGIKGNLVDYLDDAIE